MRTVPYIRSLNHIKITFLDIKPNMIKVDAILLHLAKTCRYHAMIDGWYSNAEHSILCSDHGETLEHKRALLVHDFGEHITADVAGPVKVCCLDYNLLCKSVQNVMDKHFLGYVNDLYALKQIDMRVTASEQKLLRGSPDEDLDAEPYIPQPFYKWEWREAYEVMKIKFAMLFPEYHDAE